MCFIHCTSVFPSFSFSRFVACFAVVHVLCCLFITCLSSIISMRSVLHSKFSCPRNSPPCTCSWCPPSQPCLRANLSSFSCVCFIVSRTWLTRLAIGSSFIWLWHCHPSSFILSASSSFRSVSSSDSQLGFGRRICSISFLRAVFSSTICDVTSSSVHCSAHFPSLLALALVIFLTCCWAVLNSRDMVSRLARTFLRLPLLATLLAHVCSMRPAILLHAVFLTALVLSATWTLPL